MLTGFELETQTHCLVVKEFCFGSSALENERAGGCLRYPDIGYLLGVYLSSSLPWSIPYVPQVGIHLQSAIESHLTGTVSLLSLHHPPHYDAGLHPLHEGDGTLKFSDYTPLSLANHNLTSSFVCGCGEWNGRREEYREKRESGLHARRVDGS